MCWASLEHIANVKSGIGWNAEALRETANIWHRAQDFWAFCTTRACILCLQQFMLNKVFISNSGTRL
jgi:hypothetical protein